MSWLNDWWERNKPVIPVMEKTAERLKQVPMQPKIQARLIRKWFSLKGTIGEFYLKTDDGNWEFQCYMLEDVARCLGVKIYGDTCIPPGRDYFIETTYSNKYKKLMPLVYNKDDFGCEDGYGVRFTGSRIHSGNFIKDTYGCQLPGIAKNLDKTEVYSSKKACEIIYPKLAEGKIPYEIIVNQQLI